MRFTVVGPAFAALRLARPRRCSRSQRSLDRLRGDLPVLLVLVVVLERARRGIEDENENELRSVEAACPLFRHGDLDLFGSYGAGPAALDAEALAVLLTGVADHDLLLTGRDQVAVGDFSRAEVDAGPHEVHAAGGNGGEVGLVGSPQPGRLEPFVMQADRKS